MANIRSVTASYGKRTSPAQYQHEELRVEVGIDYDESEAGLDQLTPLMLKVSFAVQQVVHERLGAERPRPPADFVVDTTEADIAEASKKGGKGRGRKKAADPAPADLAELDAPPAVDLTDPATTTAQITAQAKADVRGGGADPLAELDQAPVSSAAPAPSATADAADAGLAELDPIAALEAAAAAPAEPTMIIDNQQWTTMVADAIGKLGPDFSQRVLARMRELGHARMDAFTQEQRAEVLRWITDAEKAKK